MRFPTVPGRSSLYALAIAIACGLSLVIFLLFRNGGSFGDEGSVCTIAQGILRGELPYLHYFNEKAPLQYFWTAFVMLFFGDDVTGTRIAAAITLASSISLLLIGLARRKHGALALIGWGVVIGLIGLTMRIYNNLAESSLALLYAASATLVLHRTNSAEGLSPKLRGVALGLLQGLACGFRQQALASALLLSCLPGQRIFSRVYYTVGLLLGMGIWTGMLALGGILDDFVGVNILVYHNQVASHEYMRLPDSVDVPGVMAWSVLLCLTAWTTIRRRENTWMIAWALTAAIPFFMRMDAFRLWPSTALLFAVLLLSGNEGREKSFRHLPGAALLLVGIVSQFMLARPEGDWYHRDIASHIQSLTTARDSIWVGPYDPAGYCFANRASASRYYFMLPWIANKDSQKELVADIVSRRPKLIVETSHKDWTIDRLVPDLRPLLNERYRLVEEHRGAKFFVRRDGGETQAAGLPDRAAH